MTNSHQHFSPNPLPQPMAAHMNMALMSYVGASSSAALMASNADSLNLPEKSRKELEALAREVENAARNKLVDFYAGLAKYTAQKIGEWQPRAKIIWQEGSTRIWDYGGKGEPILFVSPLINRASILDLEGDKSLMGFLKQAGLRPLLVDWGAPGNLEKNFTSDEYIGRLRRFARDEQFLLAGYCMGGLMALKLAQHIRPRAMLLMATPWNFHSPDVRRMNVPKPALTAILDRFEYMPHEMIQSLFMIADPWRVYDKYSRYRKEYNEIEHWVNSGVPMARPLAKEIIISWAHDNSVGRGEWVDVSALDMPCFLACPTADKIVPIGCSVPLAGLLANSEMHKFSCGHVGLVTNKELRARLKEWLAKVF